MMTHHGDEAEILRSAPESAKHAARVVRITNMSLRWIDRFFAMYLGAAALTALVGSAVSQPPPVLARPAIEGRPELVALHSPSREPLAGLALSIAAGALFTRGRFRHSVAGASCVASLFMQPAVFFVPAVLATGWWLPNLLPPGDRGGLRAMAVMSALVCSIVGFAIAQFVVLRERS